MTEAYRHPIRVVARRTGLSPHVIRAWERRYEAIKPHRTDTNRRLYSDDQIKRLQLLRRLIRSGRSIGQIANLPLAELEGMIAEEVGGAVARIVPASEATGDFETSDAAMSAAMRRIEEMDAKGLEDVLGKASIAFTQPVLVEEVVLPLMDLVGERWRSGQLKIVHEHVASAIVRNFLGTLSGGYGVHPAAPMLVVATPAGQTHELGALSVVATAHGLGWRTIYLGPDLPTEEIAAGVQRLDARFVALSMVHPPDDPHVGSEIIKLRKLLGDDVTVFAGGRAALSYGEQLREIRAIVISDLAQFRAKLEQLSQRHVS